MDVVYKVSKVLVCNGLVLNSRGAQVGILGFMQALQNNINEESMYSLMDYQPVMNLK